MEDDEDDDPLWWQSRVTHEQFEARKEEARRRVEKETREQHANWELQQAKWEEYGFNSAKRSWAIWKRYKGGGVTLKQVGNEFGLTPGRVHQIVKKYDHKLRGILDPKFNVMWENVSDEVREATLGVEFVFRNELTFDPPDYERGWDRLEPYEYGSAYDPLLPEWKKEWGRQDKSPAKPEPAYTFYKTIIEKEQTNDG